MPAMANDERSAPTVSEVTLPQLERHLDAAADIMPKGARS